MYIVSSTHIIEHCEIVSFDSDRNERPFLSASIRLMIPFGC
ncbi:Protein of unknown function [Gryllus bimaculatus]|nr:Protein of unknown function [Gryllus bimaculatus]